MLSIMPICHMIAAMKNVCTRILSALVLSRKEARLARRSLTVTVTITCQYSTGGSSHVITGTFLAVG